MYQPRSQGFSLPFFEGKALGTRLAMYGLSLGMSRSGGYGFQAVYAGIGYINQSVWV